MTALIGKLKRIDWSIILLLLMLMVVSTLLVYSGAIDDPSLTAFSIEKHVLNCIIAFIAFLMVSLIDVRWLIKLQWFWYVIGVLLLGGLFKWGTIRNNANGWYDLPGSFDLQPAELMKLVIIITITALIAKRNGERLRVLRDVLPIGLLVFIPFMLVFMLPDLGNAVIYLFILLGMYWIGNIKLLHVLLGTAIIVGSLVAGYFLFQQNLGPIEQLLKEQGKGHWFKRIDTFINPHEADETANWHSVNAKVAIGSGSLTGDGYLKGTSIHKNFVPFAYSDAIFVVAAEEFGFIGGAFLLVLYFFLIYRMIIISMETKNLGGSYFVVGIVTMFVFQIFVNIGMWLGILPITGITLPFISYGGTSLLINMISIGMVMSVRMHQDPEKSVYG